MQTEFGAERDRECAFGAAEERREIQLAEISSEAVQLIEDHIELVSRAAAHRLRETLSDQISVLEDQIADFFSDALDAWTTLRRSLRKLDARAVPETRVDPQDIVGCPSVEDRSASCGVVPYASSDVRLSRCRRIGREEQSVRSQTIVEIIDRHPWLDLAGSGIWVNLEQFIAVRGEIEDHGFVDALSSEACPASSRQHRDTHFAEDLHAGSGVLWTDRDEHTDRFNLVDRRVGRVDASRGLVEADFAAADRTECLLDRWVAARRAHADESRQGIEKRGPLVADPVLVSDHAAIFSRSTG